MKKSLFSLAQAAVYCAGELVSGALPGGTAVLQVVVDSRASGKGALFVALSGQKTDGHLYISEAFRAGACAAMVRRDFWLANREPLRRYAFEYRAALLVVEDTLAGLHALAAGYLKGNRALRIAITGSNGKTSTKELLGAVLSLHAPTFVAPGNLNSDIGLPLSVFGINKSHRFAVLELGMNRPGEMDMLVDLVKPSLALITNIGTAHIGNLGSQERIAAEKSRVFAYLGAKGCGFVPEADAFSGFLENAAPGKVRRYGRSHTPGLGDVRDLGLDGWLVNWRGVDLAFRFPGVHNLSNCLGVLSLCEYLGVPVKTVVKGLSGARPVFGRSQIVRGSVTMVVDCYNANPDSMQAALDFVASLDWKGRKILVLGAMRELGEYTVDKHRKLGERLTEMSEDSVFLLGEEMRSAAAVLQAAGKSCRIYGSTGELGTALVNKVKPGDLVLFKGSRSTQLEEAAVILGAAYGMEVPR